MARAFAAAWLVTACGPRRTPSFEACRAVAIGGGASVARRVTAHVFADASRACDDDLATGPAFVMLHATGQRALTGGALDTQPYGLCWGGAYDMAPTPWESATRACVTDVASEVLRRARGALTPERARTLVDTPCGRINGPGHPANVYTLVVTGWDAVPIAVESAAATLEELGVQGRFAVAVWPPGCAPPLPTPATRRPDDPRLLRRH
jgi:hypothetical protein